MVVILQANLIKQEARLEAANSDLASAQAQLDEKQAELDEVQALFDAAMAEKQVRYYFYYINIHIIFLVIYNKSPLLRETVWDIDLA